MQSRVKDTGHIVIHGWMLNQLNLKGNDLMVYAIIYGFSQTTGTKFTGSLQYLADWCGATKRGILKNLNNLIARNLIEKEDQFINGVKFCSYMAVNKVHEGIEQSSPNVVNKVHGGIEQSSLNNIDDNIDIDNIEDNIGIESGYATQSSPPKTNPIISTNSTKTVSQRFVDMYHEKCNALGKVRSITPARDRAMKNLVKKYGFDAISEVFEKVNRSKFLTGENDRGWSANLDFILREDKFVSILEGKYDNGISKGGFNAVRDVEHLDSTKKTRRMTEEEKAEFRRKRDAGELRRA